MAAKTKEPKAEKETLGKAQSFAVFEAEKDVWEKIAAALGHKPCPLVRVAMREFAEKYSDRHKISLKGLPAFLRLDA